MNFRLPTLCVFAGLATVTTTAFAQTDQFAMARAAAANQLGVLEYCQGRGDVGSDAVAAQRAAIARLPASTASTDADEALGKQGTLSAPNGARTTLDNIASTRGVTVSALCKQMGSATVQSAAALQQSPMVGTSSMPTMPTMPNGMVMPTLPNGMVIPTIPGSPAPR